MLFQLKCCKRGQDSMNAPLHHFYTTQLVNTLKRLCGQDLSFLTQESQHCWPFSLTCCLTYIHSTTGDPFIARSAQVLIAWECNRNSSLTETDGYRLLWCHSDVMPWLGHLKFCYIYLPFPFSPKARAGGTVIFRFSPGHISIIPMSRPLMICPMPSTNHWGCPALSDRLKQKQSHRYGLQVTYDFEWIQAF